MSTAAAMPDKLELSDTVMQKWDPELPSTYPSNRFPPYFIFFLYRVKDNRSDTYSAFCFFSTVPEPTFFLPRVTHSQFSLLNAFPQYSTRQHGRFSNKVIDCLFSSSKSKLLMPGCDILESEPNWGHCC